MSPDIKTDKTLLYVQVERVRESSNMLGTGATAGHSDLLFCNLQKLDRDTQTRRRQSEHDVFNRRDGKR